MDGITLRSIKHPKASIFRRIWNWVRPPRISWDSLETEDIEVEISPQEGGLKLRSKVMRIKGCSEVERTREQVDDLNDLVKAQDAVIEALSSYFHIVQMQTKQRQVSSRITVDALQQMENK